MAIKISVFEKYAKVQSSDLKGPKIYKSAGPLRPYRARCLGYKKVPAMVVVVGSVKKGGIEPRIPARGRTPSKIYSKFSRNIALKNILKNRVTRKYPNLELMGFYFLYQNGKRCWYQFIFKDPHWVPPTSKESS